MANSWDPAPIEPQTVDAPLSRSAIFLTVPPGRYDRILDFSTAVTGSAYFVPSDDLLESPAD